MQTASSISQRKRLPWFELVWGVVCISALWGGWSWLRASAVAQAVGEGRTVADLVENVGKWASQYGGVHIRTEGAQALPGSFLTRTVYSRGGDAQGPVQGARVAAAASAPADAPSAAASASALIDRESDRAELAKLEAYHWKNPALVQREVADVVTASGSRAQFRLTAPSVLNKNNAPNAFEKEALSTIAQAFSQSAADPAASAASRADKEKWSEYWTVEGDRLLYARAVIAQPSCLRCHDTPEKAPDFLKQNPQFNGGGGFGYVAGAPIGVISVTLPLPHVAPQVVSTTPPWSLAGLGVAGLGLIALPWIRRRQPSSSST